MKPRSAAAELLDRDIPVDYLREWADILAVEQKTVEAKFSSILVFRIASEWLGLPTQRVEEVTEVGVIRRLPHRAGSLVRGIVSLRGEVMVCVALDVLLCLGKQGSEESENHGADRTRLIVCSSGAGKLSFVASEIHGVKRYAQRELRKVPVTVSKSSNTYTTGILPWREGRTIGCLDAELLFHSLDKGLS